MKNAHDTVGGVPVYEAGECDVAVIGAGHAGIEAGLAAARLGLRTAVFTVNLDAVGNMPCNPAIGGTGKGQLVRELDALGGEMARAADAAAIQYRMLNRGKGPAVHSLRAQCDRRRYQEIMKHTLERHENLTLRQAEIARIETDGSGAVCAVVSASGARWRCRARDGDLSPRPHHRRRGAPRLRTGRARRGKNADGLAARARSASPALQDRDAPAREPPQR